MRVHDELAPIKRDGRDGQGGHEDGCALQQCSHRTSGRVVSELERKVQRMTNVYFLGVASKNTEEVPVPRHSSHWHSIRAGHKDILRKWQCVKID